jgi:hypothetical protein
MAQPESERLRTRWKVFQAHLEGFPQAVAVIGGVELIDVVGGMVRFMFAPGREWLLSAGEEVRDQIEAGLTLTLGYRCRVELSLLQPPKTQLAPTQPEVRTRGSSGPSVDADRRVAEVRLATQRAVVRQHEQRLDGFRGATLVEASKLTAPQLALMGQRWQANEPEAARDAAVRILEARGIRADWGQLASVVRKRTPSLSGAARGAITDAILGRTCASDLSRTDVMRLTLPFDDAVTGSQQSQATKSMEEASQADQQAVNRSMCVHGALPGRCPYVACQNHPLGGMALDAD